MGLDGAKIERGKQGVSVLTGSDGTSALIGHGTAVVDKIALKEIKTIFQLKDAEELGITKGSANERMWYHIKEFYLDAVKGTKLFIMLISDAVVATELTTKMVDIITDTPGDMAKAVILAGNGEIRQIGFFMNPAATYVATILNGMDEDSFNSIAAAQALYDWADERHMPCNILVEGRELSGLASAAQDLRAIPNTKAHKVSLVIGQDWDYAETLDAIGEKMAAVGRALGTVASVGVNINIGEVETINLSKGTTWKTAGLSSHVKVSAVLDDLATLDTKGYIFGMTYVGVDGVRWNNDHTCTPIELDSDNNLSEYSISYGRTVDKARRKLRAKLIGKVKTNQRIDPVTGKLAPGTVEYFNGLGDSVFEEMSNAGEISSPPTGSTRVNPDSNLTVAPRILEVDFSLIPNGQIDEIKGKINLKTQL